MNWKYLFCITICSSVSLAKVDIKTTRPLIIPVDKVTPQITQKDVAEVIPLDMQATDNSGHVVGRIADRGLQYWYNKSVKQSAVGRFAESAQQKLKADVVVPASAKSKTSHKFSVRVEAFQTLAKVEYTGWTRAQVGYNARKSETGISVREKLWKDKDIVVSHAVSPQEGVSTMGVGWSW